MYDLHIEWPTLRLVILVILHYMIFTFSTLLLVILIIWTYMTFTFSILLLVMLLIWPYMTFIFSTLLPIMFLIWPYMTFIFRILLLAMLLIWPYMTFIFSTLLPIMFLIWPYMTFTFTIVILSLTCWVKLTFTNKNLGNFQDKPVCHADKIVSQDSPISTHLVKPQQITHNVWVTLFSHVLPAYLSFPHKPLMTTILSTHTCESYR